VTAIWPETTVTFRAVQMQKRNWYNLIKEKPGHPTLGLSSTYPSGKTMSDWGVAQQSYRGRIGIYYIAADYRPWRRRRPSRPNLAAMQECSCSPGRLLVYRALGGQ